MLKPHLCLRTSKRLAWGVCWQSLTPYFTVKFLSIIKGKQYLKGDIVFITYLVPHALGEIFVWRQNGENRKLGSGYDTWTQCGTTWAPGGGAHRVKAAPTGWPASCHVTDLWELDLTHPSHPHLVGLIVWRHQHVTRTLDPPIIHQGAPTNLPIDFGHATNVPTAFRSDPGLLDACRCIGGRWAPGEGGGHRPPASTDLPSLYKYPLHSMVVWKTTCSSFLQGEQY
jgi:hypothetical protein